MTGKAGAAATVRALNPMPSPYVYPKEPWSAGKMDLPALAMAAGCAWGLSQRLAEYR